MADSLVIPSFPCLQAHPFSTSQLILLNPNIFSLQQSLWTLSFSVISPPSPHRPPHSASPGGPPSATLLLRRSWGRYDNIKESVPSLISLSAFLFFFCRRRLLDQHLHLPGSPRLPLSSLVFVDNNVFSGHTTLLWHERSRRVRSLGTEFSRVAMAFSQE